MKQMLTTLYKRQYQVPWLASTKGLWGMMIGGMQGGVGAQR